jgi:nanoRNase/pAp phosphatase (c-di-AMP/oligoRNAs hydrolase)
VHCDVFNGDADGIFALAQLRKSNPKVSTLFTGTKRDIGLLRHLVEIKNSTVTVLDISMEKNLSDLNTCLKNNNQITWFDHHQSGTIPKIDLLDANIDTSPKVCTSILVDHHLSGAQRAYAIAGAYGDNLHSEAELMGENLSSEELAILKDIGETINYNGYGEKLSDLAVEPKMVYLDLLKFDSPFEFAKHSEVFAKIKKQMIDDAQQMQTTKKIHSSSVGDCLLLPDHPSSARMSGIYSNDLVHANPDRAHAIFTQLKNESGFRISIRSPLNRPYKADTLANLFPNGGGRAKAAGINCLHETELNNFYTKFDEVFSC